jgi:hypothetical protein
MADLPKLKKQVYDLMDEGLRHYRKYDEVS